MCYETCALKVRFHENRIQLVMILFLDQLIDYVAGIVARIRDSIVHSYGHIC